jgi:putative MATE family efflux protein
MENIRKDHILADDNIGRLHWKLAVPAMVGMFVMALYNLVDTIFVGRFVGTNAIAGLSVSFPMQMIVMGFGIMNGIGASALISISLGEGNRDKANKIFHNALLLTVIYGLAFTIGIQVFLDKIIVLFGASPDVLPLARDYLRIIMLGSTFQIAAMTGNNIIRSEGQAKIAMISMAGGAGLNIILDAIFIIILKMGVPGVALGTVIAQIFQTVYQYLYFKSPKSSLLYKLQIKEFNFSIVKKISRIGIASFFRNISGSLMMIIFNNVLRFHGGGLALAAAGVIFRFLHFTFMPVVGISQGMQPIVGFNFGARKPHKVMQALKIASIRASMISIASFIFVMLFPRLIVSIFTTDEELIEMASKAIRLMFAGTFVIGFQVVGATFFQAVNKALPSFILSISRQLLFLIPLLLILPHYFGLYGAWISHPVSDYLSVIITSLFLWKEVKSFRAESAN